MKEYSGKHGFDYAVVRPNNIIGTAAGNYMNEAIAIGLYIAVCRELGGPVLFPGTCRLPLYLYYSLISSR